jgi:putative thioredoxin
MSESQVPPVSVRGAVDLSGLGQPTPQPSRESAATPRGGDEGAVSGVVRDVTYAEFGSIVELSQGIPVVVDLWAQWSAPSEELSTLLERLAREYAGRFLLVKVDVDANPQISAAFQVQSIPSVVAILAGQPVPLFQGAYPEAQVRAVIEELLKVAAANGITGTVAAGSGDGGAATAAPEPPLPPLHQAAYEALEREDLDGAAAAFRQALRENPRDDEARAGLAQVELLSRLATVDPAKVLADAGKATPDDVEAHLAAADVEVATGRVTAGLDRLVSLVRATRGPERERVRVRLLELFEVVGSTTPEVNAARRALASALY